jgi:hypothetical protein
MENHNCGTVRKLSSNCLNLWRIVSSGIRPRVILVFRKSNAISEEAWRGWHCRASCIYLSSLILRTSKTYAKYSSETSVDFQRTIRSYSPEARTLLNHRFEDLKAYILLKFTFVSKFYCSFSAEKKSERAHDSRNTTSFPKFGKTFQSVWTYCSIQIRCWATTAR